MVARQERRSRNGAKQQAWAFAREYVIEKRSKQAARAVKKLLRQDVENYFALAHSLLAQAPDESAEKLMERLFGSVQRARTRWQSVLSRAQESRAAADLHALRIATKALRYRTELIYDLGHKQYKAQLKWLEELQEALGVWHDRQVFDEAVAECVARPDILLNELRSVRILLAELEKDRGRQAEAVTEIFRLASEHPATRETGSWTETDSLLTPHSSPLD
jgi:CHAD domain-containing protein